MSYELNPHIEFHCLPNLSENYANKIVTKPGKGSADTAVLEAGKQMERRS